MPILINHHRFAILVILIILYYITSYRYNISKTTLKVADFRELLKTILFNQNFLPDLHDFMNLDCVKQNHLISKLAFSHYNDRYDLIEAGFQNSAC